MTTIDGLILLVVTCCLALLLFWEHQDNEKLRARIATLETANAACQQALGNMRVYGTPAKTDCEPWEKKD